MATHERVLIIFTLLFAGNDGGTSVQVTTIEFKTMDQCKRAAADINKPLTHLLDFSGRYMRDAICVVRT
jgi:hypothetical protein